MDISTIRELGSKIRKMKDVATNAAEDCFGKYVRVRILIDITKHLKKILRIQQEDKKEIPVGMVYKMMLDYCFCCGYIRHQYRECAKYKGQITKDLAYEAWLKAIPLVDRMKFQKSKERENREQRKSTNSMSTKFPNKKTIKPNYRK